LLRDRDPGIALVAFRILLIIWAALLTRLVAWGTASSRLSLESRIPDELHAKLVLRGHPVQVVGGWDGTLGHAPAIRVHRESEFFEGGADPRGDGIALGF
jgi:gamma-glutamyltranspeptidase